MGVYILNIVITTVIASLAVFIACNRNVIEYRPRVSWLAIISLMIVWGAIYAFRDFKVGTDTSGYVINFLQMNPNTQSLLEVIEGDSDKLFTVVSYICSKVSGGNWYFFAIVFSIITYFPVLMVLKSQDANNFVVSVWIYIALLQCYYGFNGMRQAASIGITFLAYNMFFKEKKYISYVLVMLIAFGFHSTVLFIIPVHLCSRLKLKSKFLWVVVIGLALSSLSFSSLWNMAISTLSFVGNDVLANRYADNTYGGSGLLRVVVCLAPVILGVWKHDILEDYEKDIDSEIVFLMFNVVFMLFSTNNWLFSRLAAYFDIFTILFIPKLKYIFSRNSRKIASLLICLLYFGYMIAMLLHGEAGLYPYAFKF